MIDADWARFDRDCEKAEIIDWFPNGNHWLENLLELDAIDKLDDAIDVLFDNVERAFSHSEQRRYLMVCFLSDLDVGNWSTTMLVALLSITRPLRGMSRLIELQKKVREILIKREPERDIDKLIKGLIYHG